MNKDKIIKDLKKRNDSLKMQYEYRNIRCIHLEKENERLQQENQQLKKQKDDVVEYIKKDWYSKNTRDINRIVIGDWRIDILRMLGEIDDSN